MEEKLTNEEQRVEVYADEQKPTNPTSVTPDTPLGALRLNWAERDLPENQRTKHVHRLHPYLGKFIPQIVEVFLRKYFAPGQTVFDPFAGSGTTLVQANELGIHAIGYDISSFNVMICRAKTAHYDLKQLRYEVTDILERVQEAEKSSLADLPLFHNLAENRSTATSEDKYLNTWFAPRALSELLTYCSFIEGGQYEYTDLLKVILSRAARSSRLTTHFDLDFPKYPQLEPYWCYKHSRTCVPTTEAFKFLQRYSLDTLKRIETFAQIRTDAQTWIHNLDSRKTPPAPIDGVITSPPYVGLIDYHDQHAYAYHLLNLEDKSHSEIGPAKAGTSQKAKQHYQEDIVAVFQQALQSLPSGGRLIVVAADRANLYPAIAEKLKIEVEGVVERHVNRRTGRRSGEFYESVFIWRKP